LPLLRRSQAVASTAAIPATGPAPVILLDTLGELAACWGLANVAFVGGSLTNRGGQNMLEPAGYGAAVLFGPNTWNFKDISQALLAQKAAMIVRTPEDMKQILEELLQQPALAGQMGSTARRFVAEQQGATARTVDQIGRLLQQNRISRAA
jgi:3-deoxy-D-manno-octulosonic-acid transferase